MKVVSTIGILLIIYGIVSFLLTSLGISIPLFNNVNLASVTTTLGVIIMAATKLSGIK